MTYKSGPTTPPALFTQSFSRLEDYRRTTKGNIRYSLMEIIFLTISGMVSGCHTFEEIADFGKYKTDWLRRYFPYKNGTPSHDTLGEFYSKINPKAFAKCMTTFMQSLHDKHSEVVAIDGKTVKGYIGSDGYPLHILTAFCTANSIVLGQEKVSNGKKNEISTIPKLLELICIENAIVTIDAIGCQTAIATQIIAQQADYILQVKNNQKYLKQDIEDTFSIEKPSSTFTLKELSHGRVETRTCSIINDLERIGNKEKWEGLKSIIQVQSNVYDKKHQQESAATRYYISSCDLSAEQMNGHIRSHWLIESMHWSLDVIFKEDHQAKRNQTAIENANILSKFAMSLLIDEKTEKKSKPRKMMKALFEDNYRQKILKL